MSPHYKDNIAFELTDRHLPTTLAATVDNVRLTCGKLANAPDSAVKIDEHRMNEFCRRIDVPAVKRSSHLMDTAIEFQNVHAEINFHMNLHLFNFGHGFRHALHEACGHGAWLTMKKGVTALHLTAENGYIEATTLTALTTDKINEFFQLPSQHLACHSESLSILRDMILRVAHSTGSRLIDLGCASFADFICTHSPGRKPSAGELVERIADHFPAFDDRRVLKNGKEVLFLKKAQLAVAELYQKMGEVLSDQISFEDINQFTVACDNVLPCVLRTLGILVLAPELEKKIDKRIGLPAGDREAQLRAAAIRATEIILQKSNGVFWAKELGDFLWTLGKEAAFRKAERHATTDTCYY